MQGIPDWNKMEKRLAKGYNENLLAEDVHAKMVEMLQSPELSLEKKRLKTDDIKKLKVSDKVVLEFQQRYYVARVDGLSAEGHTILISLDDKSVSNSPMPFPANSEYLEIYRYQDIKYLEIDGK